MKQSLILLLTTVVMIACQPKNLRQEIEATLSKEKGEFAVAFKDLSTGESVLINERESFHAASTMKTPVMIEVFKQIKEGRFNLSDSFIIKNKFTSIVDTTTYSLLTTDDSEGDIYRMVGSKTTLYDLVYRMITSSSNLATNMLIEIVDARKATQSMRDLGAKDIQVLRGVEDKKAFQKGLNNSVTAYDLMIIFEAIANKKVVDEKSCDQMIDILKHQRFKEMIPAKLPNDVIVAHKTGGIKGVRHDSGIVYLPNGKTYVLILLSKDLENEEKGMDLLADVSRMIYDYEVLERK